VCVCVCVCVESSGQVTNFLSFQNIDMFLLHNNNTKVVNSCSFALNF